MRKRKPIILDTTGMSLEEKLKYANKTAMARELEEQRRSGQISKMGVEEGLNLLLDAEIDVSNTKRMNRLIKQGRFPFPSAHMGGIINYPGRHLEMQLLKDLGHCGFIQKGVNVIVHGPPGGGKTYIACALGISACQQGYRTLYLRMPEFLGDLRMENEQRRLSDYIKSFSRYDLLIVDEWLTKPVSPDEIYLLMDFLDYRCGREEKKSVIFCSQFIVKGWYPRLVESGADTAGGESILDRIIHNCYRVAVSSDKSMRKVVSEIQKQQQS